MKRRVVCTGLGLVTPVGCDRATTWAAIKAGTPGIRYLQETFPDIDVRIGGEVLDFEPVPGDERWERYIQFALKATDECLADAGLEITPDLAPRAATVVGSSKGGLKSLVVVHTCMLEGKLCPPDLFTNFLPNMPAAAVAARTGALGPVATSVAACATGAHCVIMGTNYVREGKADVALVGSTDASIIRPMVAGFNNMRLLASDDGDPGAACRPFSRDRTGFVIGEGAGVLCLETLDGARARGAKIYGEIAGTSWGAAQRIEDNDAGSAVAPRVAVAPNGTAVAVWKQLESGVWANLYTPNGGWGSAGAISTGDRDAGNPRVAMDPNGNAVAVWTLSVGTNKGVWANWLE